MECGRHQGVVSPSDAEWHTREPTEAETKEIVEAFRDGDEMDMVIAIVCSCVDPKLLLDSLPKPVRDTVTLDQTDMETVVLR